MASEIEALMQDLSNFLDQLGSQGLPADLEERRLDLKGRLQGADSAFRPSYLDMNGARRLRCTLSEPLPTCLDEEDGADDWARGSIRTSEDGGDSSADCSMCPDGRSDSWPPAKGPSCVRPDLSPDFALNVAGATARAQHSGPVFRGGPSRWYRRRGWAALLPGRLLVFSGPRSSRPRLVLLLRGRDAASSPSRASTPSPTPAPGEASCCAACCAVYTARPLPGPAFELCCPGRKTHQLWVSDEMEAGRWLDYIRRAAEADIEDTTESSPVTAVTTVTNMEAIAVNVLACQAPSASSCSISGSTPDSQRKEACGMDVVTHPQMSVSRSSGTVDSLPKEPSQIPHLNTDFQQQQQYESMLVGNEEIYHDIAPPSHTGPVYANMSEHLPATEDNGTTSDMIDGLESPTRPLYDDIGVPSKSPNYCNLPSDGVSTLHAAEEEKVASEHLYDDIGPIASCTSVYELIQDPLVNRGIRCQ